MKKIYLLTLALFYITLVKAQDSSFQTQGFFLTNHNDAQIITSSTQLADGKLLLSGHFLSYKGKVTTNLIRILPTGDLDTTFPSIAGTNGVIMKMFVQKDSQILLTGTFTRYGNTPTPSGFIRIKPNGDLDSTFHPQYGAVSYNAVQVIGEQSYNKILLAGFGLDGNSNKLSLIRLNADGSRDNTFSAYTGPDDIYTFIDAGAIKTITVRSDDKIYVGGSFTIWGGRKVNGIVRLQANGILDSSFIPEGSGFSGAFGMGTTRVYHIKELSDSSLLVTGDFSQYGDHPVPGFCRLIKNGAFDNTFYPQGLFGGRVESITLLPNNECLIGGLLQMSNTVPLALYKTDGSLIKQGYMLTADRTGGTVNGVSNIYRLGDSSFIAIGAFRGLYNNYFISQFQHFVSDLEPDTSFINPLLTKGTVTKTLVQPDGKIEVIGNFDVYGNSISSPRTNVARLNSSGSLDETFINPGIDFGVYDIAKAPDGKTLIGGLFSLAGTILSPGLVKLNSDGTADSHFNPGTGGPVYSIAVDSPFIYVGGDFDQFNGYETKRIARLWSSGEVDNSFTLRSSNIINATTITLQADGKLLVGDGGRLTPGTEDFTQPLRIYRFDKSGSLDAGFTPPKLGASRSLKVQGGKDTSTYWLGELRRNATPDFFEYVLIKLNADGTLAATTHLANDYRVSDFLLLEDGKLLVCGQRLSNDSISYIYRLQPDLTLDSSFSPVSIYYSIKHLNQMPDDRILVAGEPARFLRQQQDAINNIALLQPDIFQVKIDNRSVKNTLDTVQVHATNISSPVTITFTLKNTSNQAVNLDLNNIKFQGGDSTEFSVNLAGTPSSIPKNDSILLKVVFQPSNLSDKKTTILIPYTNGVQSQFSFQITGKGTTVTAITDPGYLNPDLTIYPNPLTSLIIIKTKEQFDRYELISLDGQMMQSGSLSGQNSSQYSIRLQHSFKGMLLLRLMKKSKVAVQKILVQ